MKLATVITAVLLPFGSAAAFGPNGKKYIGSWKNNKQHGHGIMADHKTSSKK